MSGPVGLGRSESYTTVLPSVSTLVPSPVDGGSATTTGVLQTPPARTDWKTPHRAPTQRNQTMTSPAGETAGLSSTSADCVRFVRAPDAMSYTTMSPGPGP